MMPNQMHPDPGNQVCIFHNMFKTDRETNFKVYPRNIYHRKSAPGTAETKTSGSRS